MNMEENGENSSELKKVVSNKCIASLERHIHQVFASVRVPGEDFVYSASQNLFNALDDYCDDISMHESRPPLLIKGESGTGKSALLSNWLRRREHSMKQTRSSTDEFVFWHAVGCSRQSMNVNIFLRRMIVDLKERFELGRDIPKSQERLSWELPRFLDLASKRGKVIIVIDGLNRLVNNDNSEDALTWLPLEFPPNIRVILSVTIPTSLGTPSAGESGMDFTPGMDTQSFIPFHERSKGKLDSPAVYTPQAFSPAANSPAESPNERERKYFGQMLSSLDFEKAESAENANSQVRKSRILVELDRRGIPFIVLKPLEKYLCRKLVESYIHKSVNSESASFATGPYTTTLLKSTGVDLDTHLGLAKSNSLHQMTPKSFHGHGHQGSLDLQATAAQVPGFLLFENQITALLNHSQGGTPYFLRLFLRCLHYALSQGFCVWTLYEDWLQAQSVPELLIRIFATLEKGSQRTRESAQAACDKTVGSGGLPALRLLYSWHPSFHQYRSTTAALIAAGHVREKKDPRESHSPTHDVEILLDDENPAMAPSRIQTNPVVNSITLHHRRPPSLASGFSFTVQTPQNREMTVDEMSLANITGSMTGRSKGSVETGALSNEVLQNLGDQHWINAERQADVKLQDAMEDSEKIIVDALANAKSGAAQSKSNFLDGVVSTIRHAQLYAATHEPEETVTHNIHPRGHSNRRKSLHTSRFNSTSMKGSIMSATQASDEKESGEFGDGSITLSDTDSIGDESAFSEPPNRSRLNSPGGSAVHDASEPRDKSDQEASEIIVSPPPTTMSPLMKHDVSHVSESAASFTASITAPIDPSEGLLTLPLYFRGGMNSEGFGDILGNALALLYVSRLGLRESELFKILSQLQQKSEKFKKSKEVTKEMRELNQRIVSSAAALLIRSRGILADRFKAEDVNHTGYITRGQLLLCLKKEQISVKKTDLEKLLDFLEQNAPGVSAGGTGNHYHQDKDLIVGKKVHYDKFLFLLVKLNKQSKFSESSFTTRKVKASKTEKKKPRKKELVEKTEDDMDFDNFCLRGNIQNPQLSGGLNANGTVEEEDEGAEQPPQQRNDLDEETDEFSLGPVMEESLLAILSALGVMYSPENKVLILPSDSEPFRQVIFNEYILKRGGGSLQYWHHLLIQYFQTEPSSLRKCEELPWHLKICRKWYSLRDALVDLKSFDLMYGNDLKEELLNYWVLLTEGPLYVSDPNPPSNEYFRPTTPGSSTPNTNRGTFSAGGFRNSFRGNVQDEDDNESTFSNIIREIDQAAEHNMSVNDARKKIFKNQIQPFDVVEELNKSVEAWSASQHPSPEALHKTIQQISKFLLEFSKRTKPAPHFLRLGINMQALRLFNVDVDEGLKAGAALSSSDAATQAKPAKTSTGGNGGSLFEGMGKPEPEKFPPLKLTTSNLYPYLRWMWIQFPWLALRSSTKVSAALRLTSHRMMEGLRSPPRAGKTDTQEKEEGADSHDGTGFGLNATGGQYVSEQDNARLLRVWNLKKSDPSVPMFVNSQSRRLAAIKQRTSLSSSLERNVDASYNKIYSELTAPSHIAKVHLGFSNRDRYRRSLEQETEKTKNLPFSYHSNRITRSGSLFPSYQSALNLKNQQHVKNELNLEDPVKVREAMRKSTMGKKFNVDAALHQQLTAIPSQGGSNSIFLTEVDDEIRRITNEEYIQSHKIDRTGASLIKNELDLEYETTLDRIARLKTIRNKLNIIYREKHRMISQYEKEVSLRTESDIQLMSEVTSCELLLKSLNERNLVMEKNLEEARLLNEGYTELIKVLKTNPPYVETHVKSLEVEVSLAEQQFLDLNKRRNELYDEAFRLTTTKRSQLNERINYFRNARHEIALKKKQITKEMKHVNTFDDLLKIGKRPTQMGRRRAVDSDSNSDSESESSKDDGLKMVLSEPVQHFLNAIVRKVTYNDKIVQDGDSMKDVVQRAKEREEALQIKREEREAQRRLKIMKQRRKIAKITSQPSFLMHTKDPKTFEHHQPVETDTLSKASSDTFSRGYTTADMYDTMAVMAASTRTRNSAGPGTLQAPRQEAVAQVSEENQHRISTPVQRAIENHKTKIAPLPPASSVTVAIPGTDKRRLTMQQHLQLSDSLKTFVPTPNTGHPAAGTDLFRAQLQMAVHMILEKTESASVEELIQRFNDGQKLLGSLREQQVVSDSRLVQLRNEHAELYATFSHLSFTAEDGVAAQTAGWVGPGDSLAGAVSFGESSGGKVSGPGDIGDTKVDPFENSADRYLDNQLFAKEVRLHQLQRSYDRALHIVSEVRTAISQLMVHLSINAKLLSALPKSVPPKLQKDSDIAGCMSWCEDRIMALSEALNMEANRPTNAANADDNKTISQRQMELAQLIYASQKEKKKAGKGSQNKGAKKQGGRLSMGVIGNSDHFFNTSSGILVTPAGKVDKQYDSKISKLLTERDKKQDLLETQAYFAADTKHNDDVQKFLSEGLNHKLTKDMSRTAQMLLNKPIGRAATFGLVLQGLLDETGHTMKLGEGGGGAAENVEEEQDEDLSPDNLGNTGFSTIKSNPSRPSSAAHSIPTDV